MDERQWDARQGVSISTQEILVGTFTLRASATFNKSAGGGSYTVNSSTTFTVLPPDTVASANPAGVLNVPFATVAPGPNAAPNIQVAFRIMKGTRTLN
jgi:hypothetical protein